jgi:RNA polymerase sigma factor (sigma-70 family)
MLEPNDHELLAEFARTESGTAFATLVARHVNLVYSTALRFAGNSHHAEEITQAVFIILARKAGKLSPRIVLSGWLYQAARLTAANLVKGEIRRHHREQEAYMQTILIEPDTMTWKQIAPLLDDAMGGLGETDRNAVVLRFFENRTAAEVADALQLTEAAAHKRVNRALEKLRKFFTKRGVSSTTAIIVGTISANSVQAAPVALAKSVTAVAIAKGAAASGSTLTLIKGALKIMAWTKMKTAVGVGAIIILAAGTTTTIMVRHQNPQLPKPQPVIAGQNEFPKESWHFAGYADPESAYLSIMWAFRNSDTRTLLASMTPDMQAKLEGKTVLTAKDKADVANMWGYRIVDKQMLSENEVVFDVETDGAGQGLNGTHASKFYLQRVGNEWRFGARPRN